MADFLLNALLAGLALALVAGPLGSFVVWRRMAYFGDTLSHAALLGVALGLMLEVNLTLAVVVCCVLLAVLLVTLQQRQPLASDTLLAITVHEELARVEGLPVAAIRLALMLLIAVVIAVAMKIVGVLLITSLLIIPAAAAQRHARTPEQMACGASLLGLLAVCLGLALSWYQDTPAGPSIVVSAAGLFLLSFAWRKRN
ncbi:metal ABC transporter permease [Stutzerimonas nitrititolerans]|uniref:metal ABC transporter permease n=1 Tax=Stutzerimonas nitrititolerans TaxID=2482751 RepID=UPI0028AC0859|nr:metal ABC transporter permease [Stutzerimonas nitrititolerans]